jgi:hypothetical protein
MVPTITVSPDPAGEDQLVRVRVEGLAPHGRATVRASMPGRPRRRWSSLSTFEADRDALSAIAERRLKREGHRHPVEHLSLTAGHGIAPLPYAPTTTRLLPGSGCRFALGGNPRHDARGREVMWGKTLEFLATRLARTSSDHGDRRI